MVRALNAQTEERAFFQINEQFFPFQRDLERFTRLLKGSPGRIRFIYLTKYEGDPSPTLISIIIRFLIKGDQFLAANPQYANVYTYNNLRESPLWTPFDAYQSFHTNQGPNRQLKEWFHLGPGFGGWTSNLFDSSAWEHPRRFFAISGEHEQGEGIYSFLIAMRGLRQDGSCLDLSFILPPSLTRLSFLFRNLRPQGGQYLNPVEIAGSIPE